MSEDPKPTPPSGMPSAELIHATRPSIPPPPPTGDALAVLTLVRDEVRSVIRDEMRSVMRDEVRTIIRDEMVGVENRVAKVESLVAAQATALTAVAQASANAANHALEAKQIAGRSDENARTIVESALRIHSASIGATVDDAVKQAMGSVRDDVERVDGAQQKANEAIGAIVEELGIEDRVELGRTVKPGEKRSLPVLQRVDLSAKKSTVVQLVIALGIIVEALIQVFRH